MISKCTRVLKERDQRALTYTVTDLANQSSNLINDIIFLKLKAKPEF